MSEKTILEQVKEFCGVAEEESFYDNSLLVYINGTISKLTTVGVDEFSGMVIDNETMFPDFENNEIKNIAKSYLSMAVSESFDPSINSTVTASVKDQLKEYEFRLVLLYDGGEE